jgi:hypothetical protein
MAFFAVLAVIGIWFAMCFFLGIVAGTFYCIVGGVIIGVLWLFIVNPGTGHTKRGR